MEEINIKRGDTLSKDITRVDLSGNPVDLTGVTITCEVEHANFTAALTVTPA